MIDFESEKIHEKCGVLGVFLDKSEKSNDLAETCYYGLLALQHRGKEASGIAVCNEGKFKCEVLKSIRQHVADFNKIEYKPTECSHKVCATGCCPVCDNELAWLTKEYYKKINNK